MKARLLSYTMLVSRMENREKTLGPRELNDVCWYSFGRRDGKALERFLQDYFAGNLKRYLKSEPVPESNDGPVKVNWDSILESA